MNEAKKAKAVEILEMENAEGVTVNVDPRTVEEVREMPAPGLVGLVIGKIMVIVREGGKEAARKIGKARGRNCPYKVK